jgi:putative transposase
MARRPRMHSAGLLYHVIVRGNQRRKTFRDDRDYQAYLDRLARYQAKFGVKVYAYCLMPNHVHLLVEVSTEPLAKFMQGLQQGYTQYFNLRYNKVGHLFQGRYHAIICDKDEYLLALMRYIHLNPVRAKMVRKPEEYGYSGHGEYCGRKGARIVESSMVLKMLGGIKGYRKFILDGTGEGHKEEYYEVADQRFLGPEGFGEKLTNQVDEREDAPRKREPLGKALGVLSARLGVEPGILRGTDRSWKVSRARAMAGYVLIRRRGYRLTEVASLLGRDLATMSSLISRLGDQVHTDKRLRTEIDKLAKIV